MKFKDKIKAMSNSELQKNWLEAIDLKKKFQKRLDENPKDERPIPFIKTFDRARLAYMREIDERNKIRTYGKLPEKKSRAKKAEIAPVQKSEWDILVESVNIPLPRIPKTLFRSKVNVHAKGETVSAVI